MFYPKKRPKSITRDPDSIRLSNSRQIYIIMLVLKHLCTCQYFAHRGTIPDRRKFDNLMESGSRVIYFGRFLHFGTRCTKQAQGWGFRQK